MSTSLRFGLATLGALAASSALLAALPLPAAASAARSAAPEIERVVIYRSRQPNGFLCCSSGPVISCGLFTETWEKWESSAFAGGGIPWDLVVYSNGTLAPGLPSCTTYGAYGAITRAATAWNTPPPPPPPGGGPIVAATPVLKGSPALNSSLAFQPAPTNTVTYMSSLTLASSAAPNYVAFLDDQASADEGNFFSLVGTGHVTLGATLVYLYNPGITTPPTSPRGSIQGFDILLNARTYQNAEVWGWFAEEGSTDIASHTPSAFVPFDGYADIQGVLTHEFGHAAGLGHSLLDGETGGRERVPTMFPFAQGEPLEGRVTVQSGCGATAQQYSALGSTTVFGGLLGRSARTLQPDDIVAINKGYGPNFGGTLRGRVRFGASGVPAASVVAVNRINSDHNRIGVLTYHVYQDEQNPAGELVGEYELSGLPAGTYDVLVEPVDPVFFPGAFDVPNYAFNAGVAPWPGCNCSSPTIQPCSTVCTFGTTPCRNSLINGLNSAALVNAGFPREVYNAGDAGAGELRQAVTTTTVTGSSVITLDDIQLDSAANLQPLLEVSSSVAPTTFSPRGVTISAWADAAQTVANSVTYRVRSPAGTYAGANVELLLSYRIQHATDNGQLREVSLTAAPADILATLDGVGTFTTPYVIDPATQLFRMIHAQARIEIAPGVYDYTNKVVVFAGIQRPVPLL